MPRYNMIFDTVSGKVRHRVIIDDAEVLDEVIPALIDEMRDKNGGRLKGEGPVQVIAPQQRRTLNLTQTLPDQGILSDDELFVTCIPLNG